jgi:hypothetical protein
LVVVPALLGTGDPWGAERECPPKLIVPMYGRLRYRQDHDLLLVGALRVGLPPYRVPSILLFRGEFMESPLRGNTASPSA